LLAAVLGVSRYAASFPWLRFCDYGARRRRGVADRHHPTPVIAPKVKVEMQRHLPVAKKASSAKDDSPVAKEALPAKDASPVVSTAKADTKKSKHYKAKVLARQHNNYRYGNALGYAEESGYGPRGLWFR